MSSTRGGLRIDEDQFRAMTVKEQNLVLFRNTNQIENKLNWMDIAFKTTLVTISGLCAATGWLLIIHLH